MQDQFDALIYHSSSPHAAALADRLKSIIQSVRDDIGEEVKVASTAEHFATGTMFESMEDALSRYV